MRGIETGVDGIAPETFRVASGTLGREAAFFRGSDAGDCRWPAGPFRTFMAPGQRRLPPSAVE